MSEEEIDLRTPLRAGADLDAIKALLAQAIQRKPQRHHLNEAASPRDRTMAQIGG
jgi:cyclic pyranopterin phosphate synthase